MLKKLALLGITALAVINLTTLGAAKSYAGPNEESLHYGILGSQQGVPVCHCPDDMKNCICQQDDPPGN